MVNYLLYPFAVLYAAVTSVRNYFYDRGLKPQAEFDLPVISVGNLTVGGTGKTPMVEYLVRLLKNDYKVATLSRGYGRDTKGFRMASASDTAATLGDEPYQFHKKFAPEVNVAVGEERALAIPMIIQECDAEVILLDDAFQHRRVKASFSILLTDFNRPFYLDHVLPAGRLRETRAGAARADVVVVTKCPEDLSEADQDRIRREIAMYTSKPVYFATLDYGDPLPFGKPVPMIKNVFLVTGIARPEPLVQYITKKYGLARHLAFADHRDYSAGDLKKIQQLSVEQPGTAIVTTEKDMVKLQVPELASCPVYYLPIAVRFLEQGNVFDEMIRAHVKLAAQKN
jgi:tetraacyldisaccharide 4'-kinase